LKKRGLLDSFGFAINGFIYCLKTQRNMRIHITAASLVIIACLFSKLSRTDVILLSFSVTLVLVCEMINTAVEKSIDLFTDKYHPLAKISKDVAAGAVFVAAANSVLTGYLVFSVKILPITETVINRVLKSQLHTITLAISVVLLLVLIVKHRFSAKSILQGGMPSGHAAVAFSLVTAVALLSNNNLVRLSAFLLGLLVLQSRVEGRIHSILEVVLGAALGTAVTLLVYHIF
jgi:diacylglycerol kinase (ATP)